MVYQLRITNEIFNLYLTVRDTIQCYQDVLETGTYCFHRNTVLLFFGILFFLQHQYTL